VTVVPPSVAPFDAAAAVTLGLLVAGAAGVVAWTIAARRRGSVSSASPARLAPRTAAARFGSYGALAGGLLLAAALGTPGTAVALGALAAIGVLEWARLFRLPGHHHVTIVGSATLTIAATAIVGEGAAIAMIPVLLAVGLAWPIIASDPTRAMRDLGIATLGYIYIGIGLAHGVLIVRNVREGAAVLVAVAVATALSDIGAYIIGRRLGRTKLAPRLSPSKTRAGFVGNLAGGILGAALFVPAIAATASPHLEGPALALLVIGGGAFIGLGAVWGDLFASAAKRETEVKDSGGWLPGFGGLLDRVDSILVTFPLVYWLLRLSVGLATP
jgi:phosphatidate cytidylyltransferase